MKMKSLLIINSQDKKPLTATGNIADEIYNGITRCIEDNAKWFKFNTNGTEYTINVGRVLTIEYTPEKE